MNLPLKTIAQWLNTSSQFDESCRSISIDTRKIESGALFVAIRGEQFDGHDFIEMAREKGAVAAIVSQPVQTTLPTIYVEDTRKALGEIAKKWRAQWKMPVIAVTGSCGKTTTKSMIAHILGGCGEVLATQGTMNNDIGLPLTIFQLSEAHQYAVFELGANHLGEIDYLADIAKPDVAVITNAAAAHLEGFGSLEGVAKAKSEIYQRLGEDGIAVLNVDDAQASFWETIIGNRRKITFSQRQKADFLAQEVSLTKEGCSQFKLVTPEGAASIRLPLIGKHHVENALAAAAACFAVGIKLADIQKGLETLLPIGKRLVAYSSINGAKILDDSYNANPLSLFSALEVLAHFPQEKILILGDMNELGVMAEESHREVGRRAKQLGIHALYAIGEFSRFAVEAFGEQAHHFHDKPSLIAAVEGVLHEQTVALVKGSRSAKMEEVVTALCYPLSAK